ncbi:hypothetical protein Q6348_12535 [Isoptericola sp. b441]|uniref:Uncharacterized protein n=1 Tax=Actinotalea lenta TaxID=3064654 RepID=A0ABT9DCK1_9CELL|nr:MULTISPECIES: hypothetical protein [unclassified Isoptericola]MDO8108024.1 hypothetical protein [Isoptericola sp. b441]MDO8120306.1 hypothetical protein [Isoptericola sp. b490]
MNAIWRGIKAFGSFWADFIFGDDWTVALAVGLALLATWGLLVLGVPAWWLLPVVVIGITLLSLYRSQHDAPPPG